MSAASELLKTATKASIMSDEDFYFMALEAECQTVSRLEDRIKQLEARIKKAEWSEGWANYAEESGPSCPWCSTERGSHWDGEQQKTILEATPHEEDCPAFTPEGVVK